MQTGVKCQPKKFSGRCHVFYLYTRTLIKTHRCLHAILF